MKFGWLVCGALALAIGPGCGGAQKGGGDEDMPASGSSAAGVWAQVSAPVGGKFSVALTGSPIADQPVQWELVQPDGKIVAKGNAKTDAAGKFEFQAERGKAVVLVVQHEGWSAWVELKK